jgi:hypothetical protein
VPIDADAAFRNFQEISMISNVFSAVILTMSIVITKDEILDAVPVGTPEREAVEYFEGLTSRDRIGYFTRENAPVGSVSYALEEGDRAFYMVGIENVRYRWWRPSLGRRLVVIVVISDVGLVSHIEFFGRRGGWP